jgi:PilZ domain-containing protein
MPTCTVLIGAPELLPALRERTGLTGEVLTFSDQEPLRALEAIVTRRPKVVALERLFAATSRGAALINRIKSDSTLADAEIRIVSHDSDYVRVSPRPRAAMATTSTAVEAPPKPERPLDWRGTRRAPRLRIRDGVECLIDGNPAMLVDLSAVGAQVISQVVLRPNQRVRITLADEGGVVRFNAAVAWASFEIPTGTPQYRAGIEFADADAKAMNSFAERHRKN